MTHPPLSDRYAHLVNEGKIESDPAQTALIVKFDCLLSDLETHRLARNSGALGWLFGARPAQAQPRGLYIHGSVGRGKTMLMDMFFAAADIKRKRRAHFHAFMSDVHARIHAWRQLARRGEVKGDDPIAPVARAMAEEAWLLCFDEFAVTDIGDAMILGRLFQALFSAGVVVVATSNAAPRDLYRDGLNRALFLPFIAMLEERMEIVRLDARTDFRLEKISGGTVYCVPPDDAARSALGRMFSSLSGADRGTAHHLPLLGRLVYVPEAANGVARFAFGDLCDKPLAAADYLVIAQHFHTVLIDGIPVFGEGERNRAKRFILLIDTLYDQHVKLIASAAAEPEQLYAGRTGPEAFEFARTASRLIEMRSTDYLAAAHGRASMQAAGDSTGIVET